MMFSRNSFRWKRWVLWALGALAVLDIGLFLARWKVIHATPATLAEQRDKLSEQYRLLKADVGRAAGIRADLPQVREDCERFVKERLLDPAAGYAALVADLDTIAGKSGLRTSAIKYKEQGLEKRGVVEVEVTAAVEGDYTSLVRFINGIERSQHFYLLDGLTLASSTGGSIKLNLELKTYFRSPS
jgi:Tfp pilus assembly protein PilO